MTRRRRRPPWQSALAGLTAVALVTAAIAAFVLARGSDPDAPRSVETPRALGTGACAPPSDRPLLDEPGPTPPPPAMVSIPGATEVDLAGFVATDLVAGDGQAWASVVEAERDPAAAGRVARIDAASNVLVETIPVVDGCAVSALALDERGVWLGTCDELGASDEAGGGLVVEVEPTAGSVVDQAALPTSCVAEVTAAAGSVSAGGTATGTEGAEIWSIDPGTPAVTEIEQLTDEALGGIALTDDGLWIQALGADTDEAVRADPASGQEQVSVPEPDATLVGASGDAVWFQRPDAIVQRDAADGSVRTETPVADVQTVAIGESGAWFQQATRGSLTITVGRIDPATGAVTHTFQFDGVDLDRSGLPFPVRLAADETGVWIVYQGRLYHSVLPEEAVPAPEPVDTTPTTSAPDAPPTTATTTTAPISTTTAPSTTVPAATAG